MALSNYDLFLRLSAYSGARLHACLSVTAKSGVNFENCSALSHKKITSASFSSEIAIYRGWLEPERDACGMGEGAAPVGRARVRAPRIGKGMENVFLFQKRTLGSISSFQRACGSAVKICQH
jgi:hypothetical protein